MSSHCSNPIAPGGLAGRNPSEWRFPAQVSGRVNVSARFGESLAVAHLAASMLDQAFHRRLQLPDVEFLDVDQHTERQLPSV
jgi:hypothetical protein